jgi:carbamoyltransferase
MKVLGVYNGKVASVTYFDGKKIVFSASEERFNRIKNSRGYPNQTIDYLLKNYNINPDEIDVVTCGAWNYPDYDILKDYFDKSNNSGAPWNRHYYSLKTDHEFKVDFIKNSVKRFKKAEIKIYDHHKSHFFSAKIPSGYASGYGIVSDGRGDGQSLSIWKFNTKKIKKIVGFSELRSYGAFYGSITTLLGFKADKHEGKITGLAAYGKKTNLVNKFKKYINFHNGKIKTSKNFLPFVKPLNIEYLKEITKKYSREDIAFAAQFILEKNIIDIIKYYIPKNVNLVAAGGVFANVKLNQKIRERCNLSNFFVFPEMSDGGISFGAVCSYLFENKIKVSKIDNMFLGAESKLNIKHKKSLKIKNLNLQKNFNSLLEEIKYGKIIGIFNGKSEFGPRALGNRSIIFSPADKKINDMVNKRLGRNEFMPFAPVTTIDSAKKIFYDFDENDKNLNYMTTCYKCKDIMIKKCPAVVHVDLTARPQVISKKIKNSIYFKIVNNFNNKFKIPCLVNTSFNTHEEPIVNTVEEAIKILRKKVIDYLIIDNLLLTIKK